MYGWFCVTAWVLDFTETVVGTVSSLVMSKDVCTKLLTVIAALK